MRAAMSVTSATSVASLPPVRLRWTDEGPLVATLRPARSRALFHLGAAAWNLTLGPGLWLLGVVRHSASYAAIAFAAGVFFLLLALRAAVSRTRISIERGKLLLRPGPLTFWKRAELPLSEIAAFYARSNPDGTHDVMVGLRDGQRRALPLDRETVLLTASWRKEKLFTAPLSHAEFIARRLEEMVEDGRRAGHDTYRT